jgi:hypothetical protein
MMGRLRAMRSDSVSDSDDAGITMIEMVVGMVIMGVFLIIFTGAIVAMASTSNKVEAVTSSSAQTNDAFLRLDKLVRYADAITTPGTGAGGDWYVELDTVRNATSLETCTQLRVDITSKQLQQRTWTVTSNNGYTGLSSWLPMASNIINGAAASGSSTQPFSVPAQLANASTSFQRLMVTLVAASAGAASANTNATMTFTALDSSATASTNASKCQQLGSALRP